MKVELLAPAGSYEGMRAAFAAGADAVYIGGSRFGARAYADNLDEEAMKRAIDYAHLKRKQLYLTVNTLLKDAEMEELYAYLKPFYREGLDAVIVQDMGVLRYVKREFPDMDIHASTQMTITGANGAALLKEAGASRVVTARELSLREIEKLHKTVDIEIESFVHGALCYCYSGQCLFSSMIGGRSGNRGRCAQPCRLPYELIERDRSEREKVISSYENKYLLSPKDMCTLEILPELLESGVYSLKIEGRMKRAEYAAGVVRIYRKYLDAYLQNPKGDYKVDKEDMSELMDLYNRGGFSEGYYRQQNGADMMSPERPNHWGTKAAKVLGCSKNKIMCRALVPIGKKDVLEYRRAKLPLEFVIGEKIQKGQEFSLKTPGNVKIQPDLLYRTKNNELLERLAQEYIDGKYQEKINGKLILSRQKCAILTISFDNLQVEVTGEVAQQAQNRPLRKEDVEKQLRKTGGTEFQFERLDIEMDEDLFMPMQEMNELRRRGLESLERAVIERSRRTVKEYLEERAQTGDTDACKLPYLAASVESREGFLQLLQYPEVQKIYLDNPVFESKRELAQRAEEYVQMCHESGKECFYIMPWIFREQAEAYYESAGVMSALEKFDGILIKNVDEYQFLKKNGYKKQLAADYNLYTWNREACKFWEERSIDYDTVPLELNAAEIRKRGCVGSELLVYGYVPLMVSAQCQLKNASGCRHQSRTVYLKDRKKKQFAVRNQCTFCYNLIYNSTPLALLENADEILAMGPQGIRLQFTAEDGESIARIVQSYIRTFYEREPAGYVPEEFTRGHFKRKVE